MAVLDACEKLNKRLQPLREKYPDEPWPKLAFKAYFERISLSATGFYKTPDIAYDINTNQGLLLTTSQNSTLQLMNFECSSHQEWLSTISLMEQPVRKLKSTV